LSTTVPPPHRACPALLSLGSPHSHRPLGGEKDPPIGLVVLDSALCASRSQNQTGSPAQVSPCHGERGARRGRGRGWRWLKTKAGRGAVLDSLSLTLTAILRQPKAAVRAGQSTNEGPAERSHSHHSHREFFEVQPPLSILLLLSEAPRARGWVEIFQFRRQTCADGLDGEPPLLRRLPFSRQQCGRLLSTVQELRGEDATRSLNQGEAIVLHPLR
jgi:hypothetical protein